MKLYLDLCVYNRPFDYQGQERVALEASAFIYILEKIERNMYTLVTSEALAYENSKTSNEQRKIRVESYFQLAKEFIKIDSSSIERVKLLKGLGFSDVDALHIALAEKSNADYFITCDDEIVKLYKNHKNYINVNIVSLIEFIALEES
ncbi:MAG: PIN domain-containing protein [Thermodesulfovibrionales bacterium]|nr:PIN domain-containing protein [Thermodesulfovibrionales bacterium]